MLPRHSMSAAYNYSHRIIMANQLINTRGKERLMAFFIAGLCIGFGFLLFYNIPIAPGGSAGDFNWVEIKMMLAGIIPGTLFFLFGAGIVVYLLRTQTDTIYRDSNVGADEGNGYQQNGAGSLLNVETLRRVYQKDFRIFSEVFQKLDQNESVPERLKIDFESAVLSIKEYLIGPVWDENWGSYRTFKKWVSEGCPEPPPREIEKGARFFSGKMTVARNKKIAFIHARRNKELQMLRKVR
jgi:hypothetical protein